jgi:hypothetical protein
MPRHGSPSSVTVLGECVADTFADPGRSSLSELALRALPGGGPANTAVALARLGTPTRFLGRFSNDVFGALFRDRLSEDDLALLLPGAGLEEACDTWHSAGARLVVITLGGRGALASLDGHRVTVPTPAIDIVDTVGAGDSFTAGLLHRLAAVGHLGGRLDRLGLEDVADACSFAAHVAALTCSVPGANPPRAEHLAPPFLWTGRAETPPRYWTLQERRACATVDHTEFPGRTLRLDRGVLLSPRPSLRTRRGEPQRKDAHGRRRNPPAQKPCRTTPAGLLVGRTPL